MKRNDVLLRVLAKPIMGGVVADLFFRFDLFELQAREDVLADEPLGQLMDAIARR